MKTEKEVTDGLIEAGHTPARAAVLAGRIIKNPYYKKPIASEPVVPVVVKKKSTRKYKK